MSLRALGRQAETLAVAYLSECGMYVLRRNVYTPYGEIDILARDGTTLVVVEVKARTNSRYGSAIAAVDAPKRRRLRAAAADLLQFAPSEMNSVRFDVLTIQMGRLRLYRAAFW